MDTFVSIAIVGTAQHGQHKISTGTAVDALIEQLPTETSEHTLLLAAGARDAYLRAGYVAARADTLPPVAPEEMLPACSSAAASLLAGLLEKKHDELLPEALTRLQHAGQRLSHTLLPQALAYGMGNKELRLALSAVLGERGRWLSQFNPAWSWVATYMTGNESTLPADIEAAWQEGALEVRRQILQHLREHDPARVRDWLLAVWKKEKAEARVTLLATFETGLSIDDEALLQKGLEDRSENVRNAAAALLGRLPASTFAQQQLALADLMLNYTPGKRLQGDRLIVTPPDDEAWQGATGARGTKDETSKAHRIRQTIASVPPEHWEERFKTTPEGLIAAVSESEWNQAALEGWTQAALSYNDHAWLTALVDWHLQLLRATNSLDTDVFAKLLAHLPVLEAEKKVVPLLSHDTYWTWALKVMPAPWSHAFSETCLATIAHFDHNIAAQAQAAWQPALQKTACALSPELLTQAMQGWDLTDTPAYNIQYWRRAIKQFIELIQLRKRLIEEIHS